MGSCMSLCRTRNLDEKENPENQFNDYIKIKENSNENLKNSKEKKKKISIPKDTIYKEDEDIAKNENKKEKENIEIINTDIPNDLNNKKKEDKLILNLSEEMDSTNEIIKEKQKEEKNINNNKKNENINNEKLIQNESVQENDKKIENINNEKEIKEEHIDNNEIKEIKEDKFSNKDEENEEIIEGNNDNKNNIKENIPEEKINKVIEEKVELEKEKEENIINNNDKEENNSNELLRNVPKKNENHQENIKKEIKQKSQEKNEEIVEEPKEEIKDNEQEHIKNENEVKDENKVNEQEQENNNELITKEEEIKQEEKKDEVNEEKNEEEKALEEKEEEEPVSQENNDNNAFNEFLSKNDSLIKVININLESKGYSKTDIQTKIDEIFQSISESKLDQNHLPTLSTPLYDLLSPIVDSDKKDLEKFFTELFSALNFDKEKIREQILTFAEDIEEQEKLKTRKLNRSIRSCIKECQDQLNQIFKQDDMPSDRVVSFDKFNQIVEEVGIKMKKEYMDVLLYQMKMAVPKNRSIHDFNMIVIVDFLK